VRNGALEALSCAGPAACTAVGDYLSPGGIQVPLAERWDGRAWYRQRTPSPAGAIWAGLFGVSCASAGSCTAAGYYLDGTRRILPLAEQWNGTAWRLQAAPNPAGHVATGFFAVSCAAPAACTATGATTSPSGLTTALAERWDGTAWRIQRAASPAGSHGSELLAVSCAARDTCTAAGSYLSSAGVAQPLAERWTAAGWRIQPVPSPAGSAGSGISGVSCASPGSCTAAGSYDISSGGTAMLAESWNGARWRIQATPSPSGATASELLAVSCSAPGACTAVGAYAGTSGASSTLAERWDGTRWRVQATPNPAGAANTGLAAVSCRRQQACAAAGSWETPGFVSRTLAQAWQGTRWRGEATRSPVGAAVSAGLNAVSCRPAGDCTAVGFRTDSSGDMLPLAVARRPGRWHIQPAATPAGSHQASFSGVSCSSDRACTAVGSLVTGGGAQVPLAEAWNGAAWRSQQVPAPAGAVNGSNLWAVSCSSPRACAAVGFYFSKTSSVPFAETWNGSAWRLETVPDPAGTVSHLFGVSCLSATACTAVGDGGAEVWDGRAWHFQPVSAPAGAQAVLLGAVSCTSVTSCTAAGSYFSRTAGPLTIAEHWNGTAWQIQPTPNADPSGRNQLNAVSCTSPRVCTAVGYDAQSDFAPPLALAESWNGTRWRLRSVPAPAGTVASILAGVSCPAAGTCTAAGSYSGVLGLELPLVAGTPG
jgi:hypothetical protein